MSQALLIDVQACNIDSTRTGLHLGPDQELTVEVMLHVTDRDRKFFHSVPFLHDDQKVMIDGNSCQWEVFLSCNHCPAQLMAEDSTGQWRYLNKNGFLTVRLTIDP